MLGKDFVEKVLTVLILYFDLTSFLSHIASVDNIIFIESVRLECSFYKRMTKSKIFREK